MFFDNFKVTQLDDSGAEVSVKLEETFTQDILNNNVTRTYEYQN